MTPDQDLWDIIAIVIALDTLHDDQIIKTSLPESRDRTINQIQSILQLKKAKNMSRQATTATGDLIMAFKDNGGQNEKANRDEKCYNYHKLGHFRRD